MRSRNQFKNIRFLSDSQGPRLSREITRNSYHNFRLLRQKFWFARGTSRNTNGTLMKFRGRIRSYRGMSQFGLWSRVIQLWWDGCDFERLPEPRLISAYRYLQLLISKIIQFQSPTRYPPLWWNTQYVWNSQWLAIQFRKFSQLFPTDRMSQKEPKMEKVSPKELSSSL